MTQTKCSVTFENALTRTLTFQHYAPGCRPSDRQTPARKKSRHCGDWDVRTSRTPSQSSPKTSISRVAKKVRNGELRLAQVNGSSNPSATASVGSLSVALAIFAI